MTERLRLNGRQGASLPYVFTALRHRRDGVLADDGAADALETEIAGHVKGRARRDGLLDIQVQTFRSIGDGSASLGFGGFKHLRTRSGETVEVALPAVSGTFGTMEMAKVFEGQTTAIRVTATRLR